jgi:hypothetical protein
MIIAICLLYNHVSVSIWDLPILFFSFIIFILKSSQVGPVAAEVLFRNYIGWLMIYYFVKGTGAKIKVDRLLFLFCISVIIEAILVNTILPTSYIYGPEFDSSSHISKFYGFYQRPLSVGGRATTSSTIVCLMLSYIETLRIKGIKLMTWKLEILALIVIVLFASGTGFMLYFVYWIYKLHFFSRKRNVFLLIPLITVIVYVMVYLAKNSNSVFSRVSYKYVEFLFDYKIEQIETTMSAIKNSLMIGGAIIGGHILVGGDFALENLLHSLGISGIIILLLFIMIKINLINLMVILIAILGMFHYGAITMISGQLVFAYTLVLNKKNFSYYTNYK